MSPQAWQRIESAALAIGFAALGPLAFGYDWWWPLALFLVFDASALGYLVSPKVGSLTYNAGHSYIAPVVLAAVFAATGADALMIVAIAWGFHIAVDRAVGYGLKYPDHFQNTHLGWIGRRGDADVTKRSH